MPKKEITLEAVERLVVDAAKIYNSRQVIISGSLSVMGVLIEPPKESVTCRGVDIFPQLNPNRNHQNVDLALGLNSAFHSVHGFYANPIKLQSSSLPAGWALRLSPLKFSDGVVGAFVDPNDASIQKLIAGSDQDICWIKTGLRSRILNPENIMGRIDTVPNISADDALRAKAALKKIYKFKESPLLTPEELQLIEVTLHQHAVEQVMQKLECSKLELSERLLNGQFNQGKAERRNSTMPGILGQRWREFFELEPNEKIQALKMPAWNGMAWQSLMQCNPYLDFL